MYIGRYQSYPTFTSYATCATTPQGSFYYVAGGQRSSAFSTCQAAMADWQKKYGKSATSAKPITGGLSTTSVKTSQGQSPVITHTSSNVRQPLSIRGSASTGAGSGINARGSGVRGSGVTGSASAGAGSGTSGGNATTSGSRGYTFTGTNPPRTSSGGTGGGGGGVLAGTQQKVSNLVDDVKGQLEEITPEGLPWFVIPVALGGILILLITKR